MTQIIRAKFRALHITANHDRTHDAELAPVKRDGKDAENDRFWQYSPSGKMRLHYRDGFAPPFDAGAYYFLDMIPTDDPDDVPVGELWKVDGLSYGANDSASVSMSRELSHPVPPDEPHGWSCRFEIDVTNSRIAELFGRPGSFVRMSITFAEESDG